MSVGTLFSRMVSLIAPTSNSRVCVLNAKMLKACNEGLGIERIKELIEQGSDVNPVDKRGMSALMHAARRDHFPIVQLLSKKLVVIDQKSYEKRLAAIVSSCDVSKPAQTLIAEFASNSSFDLQSNGDSTALIFAASWGNFKSSRASLKPWSVDRSEK